MLPGETNEEVGYISPPSSRPPFFAPRMLVEARIGGLFLLLLMIVMDDDVNKDAGLIKYN